MNMKNTCRKFFLATALAAALIAPIAQAQTWNNAGGDNSFTNSLNWSDGVVPTTNSGTIIINIGGDLDGANRAIYSETVGTGNFDRLIMGNSGSTPARFDITGGTFRTTSGNVTSIAGGGRQATINQSGDDTEVSFGGYLRLGQDANSVGTYNLSGGSFRVYRNITINDFVASVVLGSGSTPGVGQQHATGIMNITGGSFLTRAGVYLGASDGRGTFHVAGSAPESILIGNDGSTSAAEGGWFQNAGSSLLIGIDGTILGVRDIKVRAFEGVGGNVTFADGALLDVGFLGAANYGTFTVMTWEGALTNNGLRFADSVDTNIWSFNLSESSLTVTAVPEPGSAVLFLGGMAGLWLLRRRLRQSVKNC